MKYSVHVKKGSTAEDVSDFIDQFDIMFRRMILDGFRHTTIRSMCDQFYWEIDNGLRNGTMTDEEVKD